MQVERAIEKIEESDAGNEKELAYECIDYLLEVLSTLGHPEVMTAYSKREKEFNNN